MGETSQYLKSRVSQHKSDIRNGHHHTALATHALEKGHVFNFADAGIIGRESNNKKRKIAEVINIISNDNTVNFKTDILGMSKVYNTLIRENL